MIRRILRIFWNSITLVLVVAGLYVVTVTVLIYVVADQNEEAPADAIVVMGTAQYNGRPSPVLRARLDHAITLYHSGIAPVLIMTGGVGRDDVFSEAGVARAYAISHGVPEHAILIEEYGRSSWESLYNVATLGQHYGFERIVLVSDPFHMLRLELMARDLGLTPLTSPTRTSPISRRPTEEFFYVLREVGGITTHGLGKLAGALTTRWSEGHPLASTPLRERIPYTLPSHN